MSSSTALFEHSLYIGSYLSGILYGIELTMYFSTLNHLCRQAPTHVNRKFFFLYSTVLLILVTIDTATNALWGEIMWINKRDIPGVPTFIAKDLSVWYEIMGSTTVVIMVLMGDALLICRLYVIWGANYWIVMLPGLMYCATIALGILELVSAFRPGGFFFSGKAVEFGLPYYCTTIGMNIFVTILICARLFSVSRQVHSMLGSEHAKLYTSLAAILIESAAPYTVMGIMFLPFYARGNNVVVAMGQIWSKLTCIAPQMIILRVASGKAWSRDTLTPTDLTLKIRITAPSSETASVVQLNAKSESSVAVAADA